MIQLNPNKRRKNKEEKEKKASKKSGLKIMSWGDSLSKVKKDAGKVWGGIKKGAKWAKEQKVTIPTAASRKAKNEAKKAEAAKPKAKKRGLMTKFEKQQADRQKRAARAKAYRDSKKKK